MRLEEFFVRNKKIAIAFSGGCDSAFLVYAAKKYSEEFAVYYVKTSFQPDFELSDARKLSEQLNIQLTIIKLDILDFPEIQRNDAMRCYYCKKAMFSAIKQQAKMDGFEMLCDGTNASDEEDERPGMKAAKEAGVLSPLKLCGLCKSDVRKLSKEAGLFTWNKASYSCLATRTATGEELTLQKLKRTESAENDMAALGFSDFRVRCTENKALVQVKKEQLPLLTENKQKITDVLLKYYDTVSFDPEGR